MYRHLGYTMQLSPCKHCNTKKFLSSNVVRPLGNCTLSFNMSVNESTTSHASQWISIDHRLGDDLNVSDPYLDLKTADSVEAVKNEVKRMRYKTGEEWVYVRMYNYVQKEKNDGGNGLSTTCIN